MVEEGAGAEGPVYVCNASGARKLFNNLIRKDMKLGEMPPDELDLHGIQPQR